MLNIKEIFKSDLDPNSPNWWAKDKVDKINFNFNQLEKGGSYGPKGTQGSDGITGFIGVKGFQGNMGVQGNQGTEGLSGKFIWNINRSATYDTIFPNYQGGLEISAIALLMGAINNSSDDVAISNTTPSILLTTGTKNNLTLANNSKRGSFKTEVVNNILNVNIGELSGTQTDLLEIREIVTAGGRKYKDLSKYGLDEFSDLLEVIEDNNIKTLKSHVNSKFNKEDTGAYVDVDGDFSYNNNADKNKVLASLDTDGSVLWKNRYEVFSALPRGSFISIREEDFNNDNFNILDGSEIGSDGYLKIGYGRGRLDGNFEGWYLANGQKWTDGVLNFEVPNLNSFNYTITNTKPNNTDYEGPIEDYPPAGIVVSNPNPIIIAGCSTELQGVYNQTTGEYDVTQTVEAIDDSMSKSSSSGNTHLSIKRNVNIIKLGEASLYWLTDPEADGIATYPIELSFGNNSDNACSATTESYFWTKDSTDINNDWSDSPDQGEAIYTDNNGAVGGTPPAGWYSFGGYSRYWTGSSFGSQIHACLVTYEKDLVIRNKVYDTEINGSVSTVATTGFYIDTPLFKDATTLGIVAANGTSPGAGWVREFGEGQGETYRRYWNGSSFTGDSINKLYVTKINSFYGGIIEASGRYSNVCKDLATESITAYYARNSNPIDDTTNYTYNLDKIYHVANDRSIIYVNTNWLTNDGNTSVIKIWDQNKPGGSNPYYSLVEDKESSGKKYASINSSSEIDAPVACTITPIEFPNPYMSVEDGGDDLDVEYDVLVNGEGGDDNLYYYSWKVTSGDAFEGSISIQGPGILGAINAQEDNEWRNGANFALNSIGYASNLSYTLNSLDNPDDYDMELYIRLHRSSDDEVMDSLSAIN